MKQTILIVFIAVCVLAVVIDGKPQPKERNGGVSIDVNKERGQGTRVEVQGKQEIWKSDNGKTKAEAYGHWDRTYGGQNKGDRSHGGGVRLEHSWGK
ncbi:hypothetical protein O3M35_001062 [Rhynocoris fuscipes]|uniref:Attacin C-terminal domain-containing protein n=1 Tax=Rhynocoris fuscipes TaxID=488301 RepID=A0AAW1DRG2_9HEMI